MSGGEKAPSLSMRHGWPVTLIYRFREIHNIQIDEREIMLEYFLRLNTIGQQDLNHIPGSNECPCRLSLSVMENNPYGTDVQLTVADYANSDQRFKCRYFLRLQAITIISVLNRAQK